MVNALLPLDNFVVINKSVFTAQDQMVLTILYQPIIGSSAVNLYLTLLGYLDKNKISSQGNNHSDLVNNMQMRLEDIKEAREKLEAIGLIKTYLKKGEINNYVYEIYNPLNSYDFINNTVLATALYNNVSKKEYKRIMELFSLPKIDLSEYKNISCKFKDVFTFLASDKEETKNIKKANYLGLSFEPTISFNEVLSLINEDLLNVRNITTKDRELIYSLAFVYNLNNSQMSEILINSLEDKRINQELLKDNCRNYYKFEHKGEIPKIVYQSQPLCLRQKEVNNSRKSKIINQFETTQPYEFLYLKQGSKPTNTDLRLIEYLLIDQGHTPGVVNVLIDYALKKCNNKLVKKFVEQTSAQWKRSKITTVSDAMDLAISENNKNYTKSVKTNHKIMETVPEWLDKEIADETPLSEEEIKELEGDIE